MIAGIPLGELAWLAAVIVAGGVLAGFLAGLFGIGGGAIIVPVLYEVFRVIGVHDDVRMQLCVGTSLAIILPTTIRSYMAHRARGAVLPDVLRIWMVPMVAGVALGALIATFAPQAVFKIAFIVLAAIISARLVRRRCMAARRHAARPHRHDRLWSRDRSRLIADGGERRLDVHHGAHPLRQADPCVGRHRGRPRRAAHHRGHDRLHPRRPAASGADAAVLARLHLADRRAC